jgi:hypothetical protein
VDSVTVGQATVPVPRISLVGIIPPSGFGGLGVSVLGLWYPRSRLQTLPKPSDF